MVAIAALSTRSFRTLLVLQYCAACFVIKNCTTKTPDQFWSLTLLNIKTQGQKQRHLDVTQHPETVKRRSNKKCSPESDSFFKIIGRFDQHLSANDRRQFALPHRRPDDSNKAERVRRWTREKSSQIIAFLSNFSETAIWAHKFTNDCQNHRQGS